MLRWHRYFSMFLALAGLSATMAHADSRPLMKEGDPTLSYSDAALLFKALSDETRLRIVDMLSCDRSSMLGGAYSLTASKQTQYCGDASARCSRESPYTAQVSKPSMHQSISLSDAVAASPVTYGRHNSDARQSTLPSRPNSQTKPDTSPAASVTARHRA